MERLSHIFAVTPLKYVLVALTSTLFLNIISRRLPRTYVVSVVPICPHCVIGARYVVSRRISFSCSRGFHRRDAGDVVQTGLVRVATRDR